MLDESFRATASSSSSRAGGSDRQSTSGGRGAPIDNWRRAMVDVGDIARAEAESGAYGELDEDLYNAAVRRAYCDAMSRSNVPATFLEVVALSAHLRRPVTVIRGPVGAGDDAGEDTAVGGERMYRARCVSEVVGERYAASGRRGFTLFWELAEGVPTGLPAGISCCWCLGRATATATRMGGMGKTATAGTMARSGKARGGRGRGRSRPLPSVAVSRRPCAAKEEPGFVSGTLPRGARAGGGTGPRAEEDRRHLRRRVRVRVGHARRRVGREQDGGVPPRVARGCVARSGGPIRGHRATPRGSRGLRRVDKDGAQGGGETPAALATRADGRDERGRADPAAGCRRRQARQGGQVPPKGGKRGPEGELDALNAFGCSNGYASSSGYSSSAVSDTLSDTGSSDAGSESDLASDSDAEFERAGTAMHGGLRGRGTKGLGGSRTWAGHGAPATFDYSAYGRLGTSEYATSDATSDAGGVSSDDGGFRACGGWSDVPTPSGSEVESDAGSLWNSESESERAGSGATDGDRRVERFGGRGGRGSRRPRAVSLVPSMTSGVVRARAPGRRTSAASRWYVD